MSVISEANEVRAIRRHLNDLCVRDASLSGQARARLICFVDALASTIGKVAAAQKKQEFTSGAVMEPIDRELAANVLELERTVDAMVPKLIEHRKSTREKLEASLAQHFKSRSDAIVVKGKWDPELAEKFRSAIGEISESDTDQAMEQAKVAQNLQNQLRTIIPSTLDKAETNLTALKSVPLDEIVAEAEARRTVPISPTLDSSRGLTESVSKRMREDRERLR